MKKYNILLGVDVKCVNLIYFDGKEIIENLFKDDAIFSIRKVINFNRKKYRFNSGSGSECKNFKVLDREVKFFRPIDSRNDNRVDHMGSFVVALECISTSNKRTIKDNKIEIRDQWYPLSVLRVIEHKPEYGFKEKVRCYGDVLTLHEDK